MTNILSAVVALSLVAQVLCAAAVDNRSKVCNKAVNLFGVTFYTAAELQPILLCAEKPFYTNPNDTDTIISNGKTCVINNSMSKAMAALSLYSGFNGCTDLMALLTKLTQPFINQSKVAITAVMKVLNKCKATNKLTEPAKENACMNQVYGEGIAVVTKAYVNKICIGLSKKMTSTEWNCCKQYAPKVMNAKSYSCYNITK